MDIQQEKLDAEWHAAYTKACAEAYADFQQSRARLTDAQVEARALRMIDNAIVGTC